MHVIRGYKKLGI